MFKGNFREYSVERLMGFLTAVGRDVEIVARPRKRSGTGGRITFSPVAAGARSSRKQVTHSSRPGLPPGAFRCGKAGLVV
jgi:hypothetical protein